MSEPATKPRASAVIHKAKWVSEAEFRFRGSATGLRGENCVLQPPNIFPEWPNEASDEGGTSMSLRAPCFSPYQILLCTETFAQIHREREKEMLKCCFLEKYVEKNSLLILGNP